MARSWECTKHYAQKLFDTAGIVRDAMSRQSHTVTLLALCPIRRGTRCFAPAEVYNASELTTINKTLRRTYA